MNYLSKTTISDLLKSKASAPAVTMYLPTHRIPTPPHLSEDQVRFKNNLHKAEEILKNRNEAREFIAYFMAEGERLLGDKNFWNDQAEGLLVCSRPGEFHIYNLPIECEEYVAVDDHYHLAPIYAFLSDQKEYYVLVLAQQNPRLYKGNMYELTDTGVELPKDIVSALNIDELHQRSVQFRSSNRSGSAEYHGQGSIKDAGDEERLKFFRIIDNIVARLQDISLPLIIAATESEAIEYKDISRYPQILGPIIAGHYTDKMTDELHEKAKEIIEQEIIQSEHTEVVERFDRLSGQDKTRVATDYAAIKDAAEKGRIETLAIALSRKTRDTIRDDVAEVTKLIFSKQIDNKSLDYLAQLVWAQSGRVINLIEGQMPKNAQPIFAIMRY